MAVAFTREEDYESQAADLPDRPVSPHPNLVTASGLAAIEAELAAARDAETYLAAVLPQVGLADAAPVGRVVPEVFAGIASDGRDLAGLLEQPVVRARVAGGGAEGLASGRAQLDLIVVVRMSRPMTAIVPSTPGIFLTTSSTCPMVSLVRSRAAASGS